MSVRLNVDVVMEGRRQEVHWNASIEGTHDLADHPGLFVELSDLKNVVFGASVLRKYQVVVGIYVKVHVISANNLRILNNLLFRHYFSARVLKVHSFKILTTQHRAVTERVHSLVSRKPVAL